jgi:hypothetical protein
MLLTKPLCCELNLGRSLEPPSTQRVDVDTNDLIDIGDLNEIDDISGYSVYLQSPSSYSVYLLYWYKSTNSDAALLTQAKR